MKVSSYKLTIEKFIEEINVKALFLLRYLILVFLIFQNFELDFIFSINWKLYFVILSVWFLVEVIIFRSENKNYYFEAFLFIGILKVCLVLINSEFLDYAFYSPPDSQHYKELAQSLFDCKKYARNLDVFCNGDSYSKRGPTYSIILSIFTIGGNLHSSFFVFFQVFLCALTFNLIIKQINKLKTTIVIPVVFILISINPLIWTFSRLVLMETIGSFIIIFSLVYSKNLLMNFKRNNIWLVGLIMSLFLNIQYFSVVFFYYIKYFLIKKNNFKFLFINLFFIGFLIFSWGLRNAEETGKWDFNPYSGCYLEKNIIESTEALKLGKTIYEIRESGVTYNLLNDSNIKNQDTSHEVCSEFLSILPKYYKENFDKISQNYKNYFYQLSLNEQPCQYYDILCEKGYWFWLIGLISKWIFIFSFLVTILFNRNNVFYDIFAYAGLFILIMILVTADAPRMRVLFEPFVYLIIGNGLSFIVWKLKIIFSNLVN